MRTALVALASLSLLAACGGSPCTRLKAANDRIFANGNTCAYSSGGTSASITKSETNTTTCENGYPKCSAADQKVIEDVVTCYEKVPPCTTGNEQASVDAQATCLGKLFNSDLTPKVSNECVQAFK